MWLRVRVKEGRTREENKTEENGRKPTQNKAEWRRRSRRQDRGCIPSSTGLMLSSPSLCSPSAPSASLLPWLISSTLPIQLSISRWNPIPFFSSASEDFSFWFFLIDLDCFDYFCVCFVHGFRMNPSDLNTCGACHDLKNLGLRLQISYLLS